MIELRSYNVERIYKESVKCRIGDEIGVNQSVFDSNRPKIKELVSQIKTFENKAHLCACNVRVDGEYWTPYIQIIEMLILMAAHCGFVKYRGKLNKQTLIEFTL